MNWFVLAVAVLQLGAATHSLFNSTWLWSLMWACIAGANFAMFIIEGKA